MIHRRRRTNGPIQKFVALRYNVSKKMVCKGKLQEAFSVNSKDATTQPPEGTKHRKCPVPKPCVRITGVKTSHLTD